uniref:Uncharacterized protein n=1 Tax=Mucochytrium quahogii TaxID=96639 RepID=A0A7S2S4L1_9STRA|mmetsp:Transcript_23282/g.37091  ORF Transcript_23282/g.37091 Transcript_23282/m.37091 type:complete len:414 (+) Transcript_23282:1282-2523(+)
MICSVWLNAASLSLCISSLVIVVYRLSALEYVSKREWIVTLGWTVFGILVQMLELESVVQAPVVYEGICGVLLCICLGGVWHVRKTNIVGPDAISDLEQIPLKDKVVVVTGSNCGIGFETAINFASKGARVVLACRSGEKAAAAKKLVVETTGNKKVDIELLDLGRFETIYACADSLKVKYGHVDILVNNAGILTPNRCETADGFETTLQVNFLGTFLFSLLLVPLLEASPMEIPSRIVFVNSSVHKACTSLGGLCFDDMNLNSGYGMFRAYSQSKLALLLVSRELSRRLETGEELPFCSRVPVQTRKNLVTVNSLMPGTIGTSITRNMPWWAELGHKYVITALIKNCEEGARTTTFVGSSKLLTHVSGRYFEHCAEAPADKSVEDRYLRLKVWNWAVSALLTTNQGLQTNLN